MDTASRGLSATAELLVRRRVDVIAITWMRVIHWAQNT